MRQNQSYTCFRIALALFALFFVAWNVINDMPGMGEALDQLMIKQIVGVPLSSTSGIGLERARLIQRYVPEAKSCFFWVVPHWRGLVGTEQRAAELNYRVYPVKVHFVNDSTLVASDCILVEALHRPFLEKYLQESGLSALFPEVHESKAGFIYTRKR